MMGMRMELRTQMQRPCTRCGLSTKNATCCNSCERDLEIYREKLMERARPL
jgi:hypothetical protein